MFLEELFFEIGLILVIAAAVSMVVSRFKQPLIIAYLIAGVIVGPSILSIANSSDIFEAMSQIGVAFLLFTVGLGLNWRSVKEVGAIALATGVGQVVFTSLIGYLIGQAMGLDSLTSAYIAIAFTFSSTIIIIKLLMDKEDLNTLYGRISVGFLLVQDFVAMLILLALGGIGSGASLTDVLATTFIKGLMVIPILWVISTFLVPRLVAYAAKSQELLFVFAVAWCFLIAGLLVAFGLGLELGALIAGVTLSGTIYEKEINARIRPLRDFFLIVFFIVLGTHLNIDLLTQTLYPTIAFSLFILIGNPLIVLLIMRALGYHPRTGFLAGTTVAQISEFSFIVIAAGISLGHLGDESLALATSVGIVTIAVSSYLIMYNGQIYRSIKHVLAVFEPKKSKRTGIKKVEKSEVFLFGAYRIGGLLLDSIRKMDKTYTIVDFDPQIVRTLNETGEKILYGDVSDENFLSEIMVDKAKLIISTIPDISVNTDLLTFLKSKKYKGAVVVSSLKPSDAQKCYELGATYVIIPDILGAEKFKDFLSKTKLNQKSWKSLGKKALSGLKV